MMISDEFRIGIEKYLFVLLQSDNYDSLLLLFVQFAAYFPIKANA